MMRNKILTLFLTLLFAYPALLYPHGVGLEIDRQEAQVISLHHDDETPLADVDYELSMAGADWPYQTGRTDARGRVVFIPGDVRQWRLRVFSEDGHGIDRNIELDEVSVHHGHADHDVSHTSKIILGIGILLSGFGIAMLFAKRNRR